MGSWNGRILIVDGFAGPPELRTSSSCQARNLVVASQSRLGCRKCAQAVGCRAVLRFLSRLILSGRHTQPGFGKVPTRLGQIRVELQRCREVADRLIPLALQQ